MTEAPLNGSWNVAFLIRDFPSEMYTQGLTHFTGVIQDDFLRPLKEIPNLPLEALNYLGHFKSDRFIWVGFRIDAEKKLEALGEARHRAEGLLDGASLWGDNKHAEVSPIAWVGKANEADLHLSLFRRELWIEIHVNNKSQKRWEERNNELRNKINRFFSIAVDLHYRSRSPLARQLRHSMRMFRHGKASRSWGVEFICKFCALEGLVCGGSRFKKLTLLKSRLGQLFKRESNELAQMLDKLWTYRNEAVHTAQAFNAGVLDEGAPLGPHIEELEFLYVGVLVFTLEHLTTSETVDELWGKIGEYRLPELLQTRRPADIPRYAARNMEQSLDYSFPGGGELFREYLEHASNAYRAANPLPRKFMQAGGLKTGRA